MSEMRMPYVFMGVDAQGDACIYLGFLDEHGDFTGPYLNEEQVQDVVNQMTDLFETGSLKVSV